MPAELIVVYVSGGLVVDVKASHPVTVYVIDEDNREIGEPAVSEMDATVVEVNDLAEEIAEAEKEDVHED